MELRWLASHSASCLHAAAGICLGRPAADARLAEVLREPAENLGREIRTAGLPEEKFWRSLVALAARVEYNRQLAELALTKTIGTGSRTQTLAPQIAGWIAELESAARGQDRKGIDELALRGEPLRQQWEARGPGMLHRVAELTDKRMIIESADVILLHPMFGGDGVANLPFNSVHIEAVLANPIGELPEAVRLGWLLAQLNLDLPMFSEVIRADRLPLIAGLAMIPVILSAAQHVELARCDADSVSLAMRAWRINESVSGEAADVLNDWWATYLASRPPWPTALGALDRMFG